MKDRYGYISMLNKLILGVFFVCLFAAVVLYARGYRIDVQKGKLTSTGIISISSTPASAQIYINGKLHGVTDAHFTLPYGKYDVEVRKEGYASWRKSIVLKGELVQSLDAALFPVSPSLTPLTTLGVTYGIGIDKEDKALLFIDNGDTEKDGVYVFDLSRRPFSLFPPLKLIAYKRQFPEDILFTPTDVIFSPDFKQSIVTFARGEDYVSYALSTDEENTQLFEVTSSKDALVNAWAQETAKEEARLLEIFPNTFQKIASDSFSIISLSPDKSKILYKAKTDVELPIVINPRLVGANQTGEHRSIVTDSLYVYDRKEDKNYLIKTPVKGVPVWHPNSRSLVTNEGQVFQILDYDGTNRQTVYSGPHDLDYFDVTTDGKLLILANFNPQFNKKPDVYAVGIK